MDGIANMTIGAWFYRQSSGVSGRCYLCKGTSAGAGYRILVEWYDDVFYLGCGGTNVMTYSTTVVGWHYFVMTFDGSLSDASRLKFFHNGSPVSLGGTGYAGATTAAGNTAPFMIGADDFNEGTFRNVNNTAFAHVQVYNRTLYEPQIRDLMVNPYNYPGLPIAHWPMVDDTAGTSEPDVVGGYHGTWTGTKGFSSLGPNISMARGMTY